MVVGVVKLVEMVQEVQEPEDLRDKFMKVGWEGLVRNMHQSFATSAD